MPVLLLNRESIFELFQLKILRIPYPRVEQAMVVVSRIEAELIALNSARTKLMMLTTEAARRCQVDAVRACTSLRPIYVTGNRHLSVIELFKGNREGIKKSCQIEIITNTVLPQGISISDGVGSRPESDWSVQGVRGREHTKTLRVETALSLIDLPLAWCTFGKSISLLPYYQAEENIQLSK